MNIGPTFGGTKQAWLQSIDAKVPGLLEYILSEATNLVRIPDFGRICPTFCINFHNAKLPYR